MRCTVCHTRARIDDEDEDLAEWTEIVIRMEGYGAHLSAAERQTLVAHLVATHGDNDDDDDDDDDDHSGKGRGRGRGGDNDDDDDHDDD